MPRTSKSKNSPIVYSPHPSIEMVVKWVSELKQKTGRDLDEWCAYIQKNRPKELPARKPAKKSRVEFGLALGKDVAFTTRLKDTGGLEKKNRITHKVEVTTLTDLDAELKAWLKKAYDRDA